MHIYVRSSWKVPCSSKQVPLKGSKHAVLWSKRKSHSKLRYFGTSKNSSWYSNFFGVSWKEPHVFRQECRAFSNEPYTFTWSKQKSALTCKWSWGLSWKELSSTFRMRLFLLTNTTGTAEARARHRGDRRQLAQVTYVYKETHDLI